MFTAKNPRKQPISPYLLVILSFLVVILVGSFLLTCPFTHQDWSWGNFDESLYIATSATCVTGADCFPESISEVYNIGGQIIVMLMIMVGGLGFLTVLVFFVTLFKKKISFRDRAFISQAVNSTNIRDVRLFVRKLFLVSLLITLIGTLLGIPVFLTVTQNPGEVIWHSMFQAVSAFNNAGFDILGNASLIKNYGTSLVDNMPDWAHIYLCTYTMLLVIIGGISYLTIFEVFSFKKKPKQWKAYTKICILMTTILIFGGAALIFLTDGLKAKNPMTFGAAMVQSITCRTAGFASYDPYQLSIGGKVVSCFLMFIGGCPLGTASGIKTTTLFILVLTIYCYFRGRKVAAFKRYFSQNIIVKAMAVTIVSAMIVVIGFFAMTMFETGNIYNTGENTFFETVSCFSTTGFTTPLTVSLTVGGKITSCVLMFLGRLGPITMFQVFSSNMDVEPTTHYRFIEEDILIG